jgi:hypothetical protein
MSDIDPEKHYVLDQYRDVVVAGPLSEQAALREATERGIEDHIAITGSSLQQVADGRALAWETGEVRQVTDGGEYTVTTEEITVVDGVEVDITVRDTGAGERRVDHTLTELKTHLGRIATTFEQRTPPLELEEIPDQNKPMLGVAWDRVLAEEGDDPEPATDGGPDHDVPVAEQLTERQRELVGRDGGGG